MQVLDLAECFTDISGTRGLPPVSSTAWIVRFSCARNLAFIVFDRRRRHVCRRQGFKRVWMVEMVETRSKCRYTS